MSGHVIAITGGKGGVGKSTTAINLGVSLRMDGYSVVLVDADVEMPNLVEMLSIKPDTTIHQVLSGNAETEDALVEIGKGFSAVPGDSSLESYGSIEPDRLNEIVEALTDQFDYVILDTGAGLSYDTLFPLGLADDILLVTSPDAAAIENAMRTKDFIGRLNRDIRGVVITKAESSFDPSSVEKFDAEILAVIPEDPAVRKSTEMGEPLEVHAPDSLAAEAYRQLEAVLTDGVLPPKRSKPSPPEEDQPPEEPEESPPDEDEEREGGDEEEGERSEQEQVDEGLFARLKRMVKG